MIKNALAVCHWFVRQALTGGRVARRASGEEVSVETAELTAEELGALATELPSASDPAEAMRLKERLTRGFYGI